MIRRPGTALLSLALIVALVGLAHASHVPVLEEEAKLLASDGQAGDEFGYSVAVDGDTIVVGAYLHDDLGPESGAAYVFQRDPAGGWGEATKLLASDGESVDLFGIAVSLDGDTLVVGADADDDQVEDSGAVYVFERSQDGLWVETAKLLASDGESGDAFGGGDGVAIDGDTVVVGAEVRDELGTDSGAVYVFQRNAKGVWAETAKLLASDGETFDRFGGSVAIDRDQMVVGARGDDDRGDGGGAAYLYERTADGAWVETAKLLASEGEAGDGFGSFVALDGDILAVGANGDSDQALAAGAVYILERSPEGAWVETAQLYSPHPGALASFGHVAVSGETVVVGAAGADGVLGFGTADLFRRSEDGAWVNEARLLASDRMDGDQFGIAVGINGDTVVVGARYDDLSRGGVDAGSAYVFSLEDCVLEIRLDGPAVPAGEELRVELFLQHNRHQTVTVPLRLWVEDESGAVIASRTTPPLTFRHGETLRREVTLPIPPRAAPGRYRLLAGVERMRQGVAGAVAPFRVVDPLPLPPSR